MSYPFGTIGSMSSTDAEERPSLWKTGAGGRAHLAQCAHLVGKEVVLAAAEPVCDMCQHEIDGHGRERFSDLDAALPVMGVSGTDWPAVKAALASVDHDEVWLPYSRSYIALGRAGQAVAWVGKSYVDVAGQARVELPGYAGTARSGSTTKEPRYGAVCGSCRMATPVGRVHECW
jgi:hypothetical protein